MKLNKILFPILACSLALSGCDDQIMEWKEKDNNVSIADIPLELKEKLANYDYIKVYAQQYTPHMIVGLGLGADLYINDAAYKTVADANFQMFTTGNAMKHSSVVTNNGNLNFETIDAFMNLVPSDIKVYGHNFIWHTQQKQTYLKSLIAPDVQVEVSDDDVCENIINNYDFESGSTEGWTGLWGKYTYSVDIPGRDSQYALHFTMTDETAYNYDCQLFWPINLEPGVTYAYSFWVKSDMNINVQFMGQNASYAGIYKDTFTAPTEWYRCTGEFTYTEDDVADIERIGIQFGGTPGSNLWVDDFKFGKKLDDPDANRNNLLANGDFTTGINGWSKWNGTDGCNTWNETEGNKGKGCLQVVNDFDEPSNQWKLQIHSDLTSNIAEGTQVYVSYYIKTIGGSGSVRCSTTGASSYQPDQVVTSEWQRIEWEFTAAGEVNGVNFDLAGVPNTYLIDDVMVSTDPFTTGTRAATRAGGITYIFKTAEEKREILLNAMEEWIKGMMEHCETNYPGKIVAWDVVNEPIDDNSKWRGFDNNFSDGDSEPVEDPANGLALNWESDHFYWGYYVGKDYGAKAFEFARKYAPTGTKLFVNDYNLETNPSKLNSLIEFVNYIDENNATGQPLVDGIGTQMHVIASSITREQVDAMFKTMAATGKLVRVTELDVRIETKSPSAEQLATQADIYQMVFDSYRENVPEAQQSGITIWSLSDNAAEHTYWYPDDSPNIFDANYERKHAYKGVCDGIAGRDISEDFSGEDWMNVYETEEDGETSEE